MYRTYGTQFVIDTPFLPICRPRRDFSLIVILRQNLLQKREIIYNGGNNREMILDLLTIDFLNLIIHNYAKTTI